MRRPLVWVAVLYVAGILLAGFVSLPPFSLLAISLGLALLALLWERARLPVLCLVILLAGWTNSLLHTAVISPHDLRNILSDHPELVTVRGTLLETPSLRVYEQEEKTSWRTMARIEVTALSANHKSWQRATGRMAVTTPGTLTNFFAGQGLEIAGVARPPKRAVAEGTFDYRNYLAQQGIYYQLHAPSEEDWRIVFSPSAPPLTDRFRAWARRALALGLPSEDESLRLEWALTLGWKTALTEEVSEPFVRAATYHIFAVDGLRMAIIFGIFFGILRALGLTRATCGLAILPLIWFYTGLTGWPASAIRASIMITVVIASWALKRPSDMINSLFAAALIILIWQPQQLFQAGFQLSFVVVWFIILIVPDLHRWGTSFTASDPFLPAQLRKKWHPAVVVPVGFAWNTLATSFAAWIGSIPLVAYYFHIVTPVSTPANLLAVPLCALVLMSNLGSLLLAGWFPGAAQLFNHAGWFLMECIRVSSHWFAHWPKAYFYVPLPGLLTIGAYYLILLSIFTGWIFKPKLRTLKFSGLALLLSVWAGLSWQEFFSATRLTILPLNGGSAAFFDAPGVKNDVLIDCGTTNSVQFITKPFLRAQGVNHLPRLLLTHGDIRQIGGAKMIADIFSVDQVCVSPVRFRSPVYRQILNDLRETPEKLRTISRSDHPGLWTLLHPDPDDHFAHADDNAVVLSGSFFGTRVLLLSDLGRPGQNALLERAPDLRADIVVTGIPSASEALGDALLAAIQPRVIIVADSEFPASARASEKLRDRLAKQNIPVIYTRSAGAVTIELRKHQWELRTMSGIKISQKATKVTKN